MTHGTRNAAINLIALTHSNLTHGTRSRKSQVEKMGLLWSRSRNRRRTMIHLSTMHGVRKGNTKRKGADNGSFVNGEEWCLIYMFCICVTPVEAANILYHLK